MRCRACDKTLTDTECTKKDIETGEYLDLCGSCVEHHEYMKQVFRENSPVNLDTFGKPVLY